MTACSACGEDNPGRARFCSECGSALVSPQAEVRKMVTVVFTDIVGSTDLGEHLDPEALKGVLTEYFGRMRAVLEHHGGLLEKYIGDAIMGIFGVPHLHEDDALRAVRAASEMREVLHELNRELTETYGVTVQARTGVNTGEVLQGDIANGQTLAIGDTVNVAARFEQAAGPDEILISRTTFYLTRHAVRAQPIEPLVLKGKGEPVPAYRLLSMASADRMQGPVPSGLVGRSNELAALRGSFTRAADQRRCERVTIVGSAGVGKSRLVHEFVSGLGMTATVVWGRCLPYGDQITYWPLREMIRDAIGAVESDSAELTRDKLVRFLTPADQGPLAAELLGQLLGLESPGTSHDELAWAVRQFLELLAMHHPAVVVLDDLQWADPAMLKILGDVHTRSKGVPLLFLCVFRPGYDSESPLLAADPPGSGIVLEPLVESDAHVLMENLLGGIPFPQDVRGRVVEAAEGNPLFVEELLAMLIDDGQLERTNGSWTLARGLARIQVPPTIRALLAARLDLLGSEERRAVDPAAVVGKVFQKEAVVELVDESLRTRIDGLLDALVGKGLIREDPLGPHEQLYRFRHLLIRDAAYDAMSKRRRAELHENFARWLEAAVGDRVDEYEAIVGYHLEQAFRYHEQLGVVGDNGRLLGRAAAGWLGLAARRSSALGANGAAVGLLRRAADLLPKDEPARLPVLLDLGEALLQTGDLVGARNVIAEAENEADAVDDANASAHARVLSLLLHFQVDPEGAAGQARQESQRLLQTFTGWGNQLGLARTWRLLGHIEVLHCRFGLAEEAFKQAADHARAGGDRHEECANLSWLVVASVWGPTPAAQGLQHCSDVLARAGGDRRLQTIALLGAALLQAMLDRRTEAASMGQQGKALIDELGPSVFTVVTRGQMCSYMEMYAGDASAAEREALDSYQFLDAYGDRIWLPTLAAMLAQATYAQDRWTEAERYVKVATEAAAVDDLDAQIRWRGVGARLLARSGQILEAERMARDAVLLAETTDFLDVHGDALVVHAELLSLQSRTVEAADALSAALALYERKGNLVSASQARGLLADLESGAPTLHWLLPISRRRPA